jgi:hypothetical protein
MLGLGRAAVPRGAALQTSDQIVVQIAHLEVPGHPARREIIGNNDLTFPPGSSRRHKVPRAKPYGRQTLSPGPRAGPGRLWRTVSVNSGPIARSYGASSLIRVLRGISLFKMHSGAAAILADEFDTGGR